MTPPPNWLVAPAMPHRIDTYSIRLRLWAAALIVKARRYRDDLPQIPLVDRHDTALDLARRDLLGRDRVQHGAVLGDQALGVLRAGVGAPKQMKGAGGDAHPSPARRDEAMIGEVHARR